MDPSRDNKSIEEPESEIIADVPDIPLSDLVEKMVYDALVWSSLDGLVDAWQWWGLGMMDKTSLGSLEGDGEGLRCEGGYICRKAPAGSPSPAAHTPAIAEFSALHRFSLSLHTCLRRLRFSFSAPSRALSRTPPHHPIPLPPSPSCPLRVVEMDSMDFKVGELLKEVQLHDSEIETLDQAVSAVIDAINSVPEQLVSADAASKFIADLGVPTEKVGFTFKRPEFIQVGGSYSIKSVARPDINVDLLVRMPKECFHEKDYLNHRYHAKRLLYLRVIEKSLKSCPAIRKISWSSFQNEARKPVLVVSPVLKIAELPDLFIRIIPTAISLFSISKLSFSRNNVRACTQATPKYNCSILEDMFLEENSEFVKKSFCEWKSLKEALVSLKVWARNRCSMYAHDCLNGYLLSIILSYLTTESGGNLIKKSMNVMQIFRVTLKFIATSNVMDKGFTLQPRGQYNIAEDMNQILQSFDVVFLDASCCFNLSFRVTKMAFAELQDEASWTLSCIDKCSGGGFEEIFMTKVDFAAKFDSCLRINLKGNPKICSSDFCMDDECWRKCEKDVHSLLQRGLSDRAKLVRVLWRSTPSDWKVENGFSYFGNEPMLVGILVSSQEKCFRVVDIGPSPENKEEAMKFRKFWGEKSELRRFKDGTIAESTVWECETWERHLIIKRICEYLISKHLLLTKEDVAHTVDQLDFCLQLGGKDPVSFSGALLGAFELLSKRLRLLEEIPLKVSSVQPLDSAFRHTSVFPPQPHPLAYEKGLEKKPPKSATTCIQSLDVMIQLEGSGNWPLDPVAIQKTKSAFLLKIGESLQEHWGMLCIATEDEVNVLMSGYSFCLRIMHDRGLNMLRNQGGNDKIRSQLSIDKELFFRSQHSSMINGLHGRYPTYGPVVRLAKRWVSAHLFSSFLAEEAIELIVAYLFLKPFPFHAPCSRITGFLRFLRLLSYYNWTYSPLIIDINEDFTPKDEKEINDYFISCRKSNEENAQSIDSAMFLAAPYDKASEAWTKFSPNRTVLKRIASYARSSADLLSNLILQGADGPYTWECLLRTPLNNYDAVAVLHHNKLSNPHHLLFPAEVNCGKHIICGKASKDFHPYMSLRGRVQSLDDAKNKLMVNFDPTLCFLADLKREFPNTFSVWYDYLGGDVIGFTWEKKDSRKRGRNEEEEHSMEPTDALKKVGEVGKGLVKSVYLLKVPKL
ncbi:nucleolar protein 6 isoform X1 [Canna indica]|uniref:Nucleolar protein 6 isoform X1 n=1 Tax=Canna indica TaxID=4628 RepID=A0AAQ3JP71_9LILI|nr:nucleolar protein 6 isoform X1 [Canna indica]